MSSVVSYDRDGRLCQWLSTRDYAEQVMLGRVGQEQVRRWVKGGKFVDGDVRRPEGGGRWQIRVDARFRPDPEPEPEPADSHD